jgi:hypothetical protein
LSSSCRRSSSSCGGLRGTTYARWRS